MVVVKGAAEGIWLDANSSAFRCGEGSLTADVRGATPRRGSASHAQQRMWRASAHVDRSEQCLCTRRVPQGRCRALHVTQKLAATPWSATTLSITRMHGARRPAKATRACEHPWHLAQLVVSHSQRTDGCFAAYHEACCTGHSDAMFVFNTEPSIEKLDACLRPADSADSSDAPHACTSEGDDALAFPLVVVLGSHCNSKLKITAGGSCLFLVRSILMHATPARDAAVQSRKHSDAVPVESSGKLVARTHGLTLATPAYGPRACAMRT